MRNTLARNTLKRLPAFFISLACLLLTACATIEKQTTQYEGHSAPTPCSRQTTTYFRCSVNNTHYLLCGTNKSNISFYKESSEKHSRQLYSGTFKGYRFSSHFRYRVTQNSLHFSDETLAFELFDYLDEESQPSIAEFGILITTKATNKQEAIRCGSNTESKLHLFRDNAI